MVEESEENRPLGNPRRRWEDNINIILLININDLRWAGHVARMGEERGGYRVLVGKPEGKRTLGIPRHRWVDNIRMDLWGEGGV